jgi:hypothetical protein
VWWHVFALTFTDPHTESAEQRSVFTQQGQASAHRCEHSRGASFFQVPVVSFAHALKTRLTL